MARIPDDAIERLKRNVSLVELCRSRSIHLERHGQHELAAPCPFHDEEEASFVVSPGKNLFHCLGCDAAGSVIDLVMRLDGLEFRAAAELLLTQEGLLQFGSDLQPEPAPMPVSEAKAQQLLERVVEIYEQNLASCTQIKAVMERRGITNAGTLSRFRVGHSNGRLYEIVPTQGQLKEELESIGVLLPNGVERFVDCFVFPVYDEAGSLVTIYGRSLMARRHIFLPGRPKGLWNEAAAKTAAEIILVESVFDALSVIEAGYDNVMALHGASLAEDHRDKLAAFGVQKLILLLDGDGPGQKAAEKISATSLISCVVKTLPDGNDPNSYLVEHGADALHKFLLSEPSYAPGATAARPEVLADGHGASPQAMPSHRQADHAAGPPASFHSVATRPSSPTLTLGRRHYHIHGLEKGPRNLKVTVRVEHAGRLHVDTLDLYSASVMSDK